MSPMTGSSTRSFCFGVGQSQWPDKASLCVMFTRKAVMSLIAWSGTRASHVRVWQTWPPTSESSQKKRQTWWTGFPATHFCTLCFCIWVGHCKHLNQVMYTCQCHSFTSHGCPDLLLPLQLDIILSQWELMRCFLRDPVVRQAFF